MLLFFFKSQSWRPGRGKEVSTPVSRCAFLQSWQSFAPAVSFTHFISQIILHCKAKINNVWLLPCPPTQTRSVVHPSCPSSPAPGCMVPLLEHSCQRPLLDAGGRGFLRLKPRQDPVHHHLRTVPWLVSGVGVSESFFPTYPVDS